MSIAKVLNHFSGNAFLDQLHFHDEHIVVIRLIQQGFQLLPHTVLRHTLVKLTDQSFHDFDAFLFIINPFAHSSFSFQKGLSRQ